MWFSVQRSIIKPKHLKRNGYPSSLTNNPKFNYVLLNTSSETGKRDAISAGLNKWTLLNPREHTDQVPG